MKKEGLPEFKYDSLSNQMYSKEEYDRLMQARLDKLRGHAEAEEWSGIDRLLREGNVYEIAPQQEAENWIEKVAGYWLAKSTEFPKGSEESLSRSLIAVEVYLSYVSPTLRKHTLTEEKKKEVVMRLETNAGLIAEPLLNKFIEHKFYRRALNLAEICKLKDDRIASIVVPEVIRELIREVHNPKSIGKKWRLERARELANRYDISDKDILEELTNPE